MKVYNPTPLQTLQLKTYDYYQTFGARYDSQSLVLLDISDLAIELFNWYSKTKITGATKEAQAEERSKIEKMSNLSKNFGA